MHEYINLGTFSKSFLSLVLIVGTACGGSDTLDDTPLNEVDFWPYSYVDDVFTSGESGADGVNLAIDEDGTYYVTTAWQDSDAIRSCRSSIDTVRDYWECVTVGENDSPEFAFFASIFNDGIFDVISCGKGGIRLHIAPGKGNYLNSDTWETHVIPVSIADGMRQEWNDAASVDVDEDGRPDIVAGGDKGIFGWFKSPEDPLNLDAWVFYPMVDKRDMRWEMGVHIRDMDGDDDIDIIVPDRGTHPHAGVSWFENPGEGKREEFWHRHDIILRREVRMIELYDIDGNGFEDVIIAAKKPPEIIIVLRMDERGLLWDTIRIPVGKYGGFPKAVAVGDIDLDGRLDIAATPGDPKNRGKGVYYLTQRDPDIYTSDWEYHPIHPLGAKDDNILLYDFDLDGDLDLMTATEVPDLGVIIFWNRTIE